MITIAEHVLVPHPPDVVWGVISDPAAVVSCIDGSELGQQHDDGTFDARLAVKFAALKVAFAARVGLELDEDERVGRMEARGADSRGSTRVQGGATFTVLPAPAGSEVVIDGVIELNGQLAGLVTTGAAVVVARMTRQFAERLTATCAARGTKPAATSVTEPEGAMAGRAPESITAVGPAPEGLLRRLGNRWRRIVESWTAKRSSSRAHHPEKEMGA